MTIWESFKIALSSIWNHKVRSLLTMLGIIIGVSAVIIIVAIGEGAKTKMTEDLFDTDKNILELYHEPFETEDEDDMVWEEPDITSADLDIIKDLPGVKSVIGTNNSNANLVHNEKNIDPEITGVGAEFFRGKNIKLLEGRPIIELDLDNISRVIMIDSIARNKLFKESQDPVGEIIDVDGNPFKIIGVYESPVPEAFRWNESGEALMPRTLVSVMYGGPEIQNVALLAFDPETLVETGQRAADELTQIKKLENSAFTVTDMSEFEEEYDSFLNVITLFISSIAGISLLVGGIGVMNIMLVSVSERTREIGLRKAIGATRGRILMQFLIEAVTLTSLGGMIGVLMAFAVTTIASIFLPFTAVISPLVIIIGVSFSALIGIVFGILPASKASKLSPIDALRHE